MIGIYKITNKNDGKVYIGQSTNVERRLGEHKRNRPVTIDDYINVLGVDNFNFEILEECSKEELDQKEQEYILKYNSAKEGYNHQLGGYNNAAGEGNGRAQVTEADVIFLRESYAKHLQPKEIYEQYFQNKITKSQFQTIWQGRSWSHIMPEVFTEENKQYYTSEQMKMRALLTKEEVMEYRKYYVNHTRNEVYDKFIIDKGPVLKRRTFERILTGDVRDSSIYKEIPIYKKAQERWELNGQPVQTSAGSGT